MIWGIVNVISFSFISEIQKIYLISVSIMLLWNPLLKWVCLIFKILLRKIVRDEENTLALEISVIMIVHL